MKTKFCPTCNHENPMNALVCAECGSTFTSGRTLRVPESQPLSKVDQLTQMYNDALIIFIAGDDQPIIVRERKKIVLGRHVPGQEDPTVDLNEHKAGTLGVSRQHAVIEYTGRGYMLRDLKSTNGTKLNDMRLTPHMTYILKSGDRIHLGQLELNVYFTQPASQEETIYLRDSQENSMLLTRQKFSPHYLGTQVSSFLRALADLQKILDEITQQYHVEVGISSITVMGKDAIISVGLEGAEEAAHIFRERIMPWKQLNLGMITTNAPDLPKIQHQLALELIEIRGAHLNIEHKGVFLRKLLPIIQSFSFNTLEITNG